MVNRTPLYERLNFLWICCYAAVAVLGVRLLQVQVIHNVRYTLAAERNRTQLLRQTAPRGRIYDRNGRLIATNQAAFSMIYMPGKDDDEKYLKGLSADLAPLLGQDPAVLLDTLRTAVREESAIRLAENLTSQRMFKLSELKTIYPGVNLIVEARRYYPFGAFASHLVGYMARMNEKEWKELKGRGYRVDSRVGRAGLEKMFERELRGIDGGIRMEIDAAGRMRRLLEHVPWRAGSNIHITLDANIQKAAEDAIRTSPSRAGAAVVLDPRNGEILALASIPDYDPNQFLLPEGTVKLAKFPEFNLALSGTFEPGSTFKIISGAAMLNENRVLPGDRTFCPGYFELGKHVFRCWQKKGHQYQEWTSGLANSCDVYFYKMGLRVGADLIERYGRIFGLGQRTRIALPGEKSGNMFGPQARRARKAGWHDGDTCNLSIGQGEMLVTPLQMAVVVAAVANRGQMWRPHFVNRIEYSDGRPEYRQKAELLGTIDLKPQTWDLLHAGLLEVVRSGTGVRMQTPGLTIAGKTGTAQNPHGDDHAWFVAYAGKEGEPPTLAVSVLIQQGGHGSEAAGPVARKIIRTAFGIEAPTPAEPESPPAEAEPNIEELRPAQPPARAPSPGRPYVH